MIAPASWSGEEGWLCSVVMRQVLHLLYVCSALLLHWAGSQSASGRSLVTLSLAVAKHLNGWLSWARKCWFSCGCRILLFSLWFWNQELEILWLFWHWTWRSCRALSWGVDWLGGWLCAVSSLLHISWVPVYHFVLAVCLWMACVRLLCGMGMVCKVTAFMVLGQVLGGRVVVFLCLTVMSQLQHFSGGGEAHLNL